jgi:hypothetical protein
MCGFGAKQLGFPRNCTCSLATLFAEALPDKVGRRDLITRLLLTNAHSLTAEQVDHVVARSVGFSGADVRSLCQEAAMNPIRSLGASIRTMRVGDVRPIAAADFDAALRTVQTSVSGDDLQQYRQWNDTFGSFDWRAHEMASAAAEAEAETVAAAAAAAALPVTVAAAAAGAHGGGPTGGSGGEA